MKKLFNYYEIPPSERLNKCIKTYWLMTDIKNTDRIDVLPDGCFDIVIYVNKNIENDILFTGLWDKSIEVDIYKNIDIIGVRFYPSSIDILFNCNLKDLKNSKISFSANMLKQCYDIDISILYKSKNIDEILSFYNFYFEYIFDRENYCSIFEYISYLDTNKTVEDIASDIGVSTRHLLRAHKTKLGLTTKNYINIIRFIKAKKMLLNGADFRDIVYECGYFDQSHFIKEFKKYTCYTPEFFLQRV